MAKFQSPLLGYNNNVRHKSRVFHIQTEDSGVNHPHIITHLFMDGGRILKSVKRSYAEHVGVDGMSEVVRQLMKEQHKAMFIALRDGQFDHLVEGKPDTDDAAARQPSASERRPTPIPAEAPTTRGGILVEESGAATERLAVAPASNATASVTFFNASDLPPSPKDGFPKEGSTAKYPAVAPGVDAPQPRAAAGPSRHPSSQGIVTPPAAPHAETRYAPARPAAIFGSGARLATPTTAVPDALFSDKTLDEVILSYLAEDLDPAK